MKPGDSLLAAASDLDALLRALRHRGYTLLGPRLRDGAVVIDEIEGAVDLPAGWRDEQAAGRYRVARREDRALFGHAAPLTAWKRWLNPPDAVLWQGRRGNGGGFTPLPDAAQAPRYAFVGVRACDLAALEARDRVFLREPFVDPGYRARREAAFLLAVDCGSPAGTCFCASMGTGPACGEGYDLKLTEIVSQDRHDLVVVIGSERGAELAAELPQRRAAPEDLAAARAVVEAAAKRMGRALETEGLRERLFRHYESPRFDEVAKRCLACGNCTMVCPTCFCTTVSDATDLTGQQAVRRATWDSCFSQEFSYVHGGSVRTSGGARYRQWLTHKLLTWHDQFGSSGCVGCGRCITWCPVGIDITEEARALGQGETQGRRA
jgi:ferredoxin